MGGGNGFLGRIKLLPSHLKVTMNQIAKNLKILRERSGVSQEHLASKTGLTRQAISLIERGQVPDPRIETVLALADYFNCTVEELVGDGD